MTLLLTAIFICFIGVGLPDSALGAAWPAIYTSLDLPVAMAGYISSTVSACTIISSLLSSRVIRRFGTGTVAAVSTLMTAIALLGFAVTRHAFLFFVAAIPLGLGAGSIDTALNNFVATHYSASKMNFLHCFYGLGVAASPYVMSLALGSDGNWRKGYLIIAAVQLAITAIAFISLPLWKKAERNENENGTDSGEPPTLRRLLSMSAVRVNCIAFFTSCALELCAGSWSSTYFVNAKGAATDLAARLAMLFYVGLALGRFLSGIFAGKLGRRRIIKVSAAVMLVAIVAFIFAPSLTLSATALLFIGLGIGPIFPNLTHLTPESFGKDISGAVMGLQQAFAYMGIMIMPWLFGLLAQNVSAAILPLYLLLTYAIFAISLVMLFKKTSARNIK